MDTLRYIHMDDLLRFKWRPAEPEAAAPERAGEGDGEGNDGAPPGGGNWGYRRGYGFRNML